MKLKDKITTAAKEKFGPLARIVVENGGRGWFVSVQNFQIGSGAPSALGEAVRYDARLIDGNVAFIRSLEQKGV